MNNKGQTLVLFVILLPVMLLLIYFVYTRIALYGEKNQQQDLANSVCKHYQQGESTIELEKLVLLTDDKQKLTITEDDKIKIILEKEINNLLNKKEKIKTELICE